MGTVGPVGLVGPVEHVDLWGVYDMWDLGGLRDLWVLCWHAGPVRHVGRVRPEDCAACGN